MSEQLVQALGKLDERSRHIVNARWLGELVGGGSAHGAELVQRHLGLCLDTCHAAVEFEDATSLVHKLRDEERFPDLDTLRRRIGADVVNAQRFFAEREAA